MTSNVKFIFNNAADRATTLSATSTSGALVPANLLVDERAAVWRSAANTGQTLLLDWSAAELIDSVCMAWTNLTGLATVEIKGYTLPTDYPASPVFDLTFNPDYAAAFGEFVFGVDPLAVSGAARARVASQVQCFLGASYAIRKLQIIINDATNLLSYVEASRLVAGQSISPVANMSYQGFTIKWVERTKPERAESGDLRVESLGRYRSAALNLDWLEPASRNAIISMISNGLGKGVWISGMPDDPDTSNKQLYGFWGSLVQETAFSYPLVGNWSAPVIFEEMG